MMIASCKRFDGWPLGFDKSGGSSGEREGKIGNVSVPPQSTHKDQFAPKPNQSLKTREKPSEKSSEKTSEKSCEEPHPKPKPRSIRFHCEFCGKDGHKEEFCYKRRREARMAKEWANKDRYHLSHDVPEPRVQLPKAKASVRTVPAWGERKAVGGAAGRATPVRPVRGTGQTDAGLDRQKFGFRARTDAKFGSGGRGSSGWSGEFADGQFASRSPPHAQYGDGRVVAWSWKGGTIHDFLFVVLVLLWLVRGGSFIRVAMVVLSLLDVLHLVINTSFGEVAVLSLRRATDHAFPFVVVVPLQWDRSGLLMVVLGLTGWIIVIIGMVG
jgi:hypothetical protein